MSNLSQKKREEMLDYLNHLKEIHTDDESRIALEKIETALTEKKYGLVWEEHEEEVDKKLVHNIPVFREVKEKKIVADENNDFNFLLEGDNLHSLKLLEKTHKGKVDVIYIDPPYNTGNKDFVYDDNYIGTDDGYRHSKWLSFMSERLKIAKELLSNEGVIFISIDDNEVAQLKLLCDSIFGEKNFVNNISVKMSEATSVKMTHVNKRLPKLKEHILFYKKNSDCILNLNEVKIPKETWDDEYKLLVKGVTKEELKILKEIMEKNSVTDEEIIKADEICQKMNFINVNNLMNDLKNESDKLDFLHENSFRILRDVATSGGAKKIADDKRLKKGINKGALLIKTPKDKIYLMRGDYNMNVKQPRSKLLFADQYLDVNVGDFWHDIKTTGLGAEGTVDFLNGKKPLSLILRILKMVNNKSATALDYFAGSGTTGHAVMQLNKEDGGNRKYILCTNNENNICEKITYQRMKNIQDELPHNLKYYKTEFIPKLSEDEDIISSKLLDYIKEMVELENMCEIDGVTRRIILSDDDLNKALSEMKEGGTLYIPSFILLDNEIKGEIKEKKLEVVTIPDYYFDDELREVNEL